MTHTNTNGSLIHFYLELLSRKGSEAVEADLHQVAERTNEARLAKLATPVSWKLLCEIVPETFDE